MTPEQEGHLGKIKSAFLLHVDKKYRKGQAEHGGDLFSKKELELLDMALDETVDQFVYLTSLREKLRP